MRNGYIVDTLTSVDICGNVKMGGKETQIYESAFYRKNFKISPIREGIEKLFDFRQKNKDEKTI